MASLIIQHLDDDLATCLSQRAARHGRSLEEEAQDILRHTLLPTTRGEAGLGSCIHRRFAAVGGVELPAIPRSPVPPAPVFPDADDAL
jgi:plasmid stability protein